VSTDGQSIDAQVRQLKGVGRSRQAIEARDHEHVAGGEPGEHAAELGAIGFRAARPPRGIPGARRRPRSDHQQGRRLPIARRHVGRHQEFLAWWDSAGVAPGVQLRVEAWFAIAAAFFSEPPFLPSSIRRLAPGVSLYTRVGLSCW
jgi:hypothetical protein